MAIEINKSTYVPYEEKMKKTMRHLDDEFNCIRAGRANPKLLDKLTVSYYGTDTPLNQVASVQVPEARMIMITPFDASLLKEIVKVIQASDLGINPQEDGRVIRLIFPPLTEERRKELCKEISRLGEDAKVSIRNIRREALDKFKGHLKNKEISEDEMKVFEQEIQKLTDKYTDKTDEAVKEKEKEIMQV